MLSFLTFSNMNGLYILLTVILSSLSCFLCVEISQRSFKIKNESKKKRDLLVGSLFLAAIFWLTHFFIAFSFHLPFSTENYVLYFILNFLLCFIGSYVALYNARIRVENERQFIVGGTLIALSILSADILGYLYLFLDLIEINLIFICITAILVFNTSFSMFRFLIQMTNQEYFESRNKWKFIGSIAAGIALSGIPYIVIVSMIRGNVMSFNRSEELIPFMFVIFANLLLMLVPDVLGEKILLKNVQSYKSLFEHNPGAVFAIDLDGKITDVNQNASSMTGYLKKELIGKNVVRFFPKHLQALSSNHLQQALTSDETYRETQIVKKDGTSVDIRITLVKTIVSRKIVGIFGIVVDITEKKRAEERIQYLAYHDELTNLPNRRRLSLTFNHFIKEEKPVQVMLLDFDRFKRINDTFGHSFGDDVLKRVGEKLTKVAGKSIFVGRMGGDEFLVLAPGCEYEMVAKQIVEEFQAPMFINGFEVSLTVSIGISAFPGDSQSIDELLKFADIAMYETKEKGSNGFSVYTNSMVDHSHNKLKLEIDLRKALQNKELMVYFQPKYHTKFNELIGSEALLRWKHPVHGFVPPNVFIPIAEESGLIIEVDKYVICEVCEKIASWKALDKAVYRVSINISVVSLFREDFVEYMIWVMEKLELPGELIELEITERIVMKNEDYVNRTLHKLRDLGIHISIDDFGTGYSSLSYLHKLPVDILKIDQSFINQIQDNKEVVSAIISMAKNLNLSVIAEGVETVSQIDLLKRLGCDEVQGYYFSPPVPNDEFERLLEKSVTNDLK